MEKSVLAVIRAARPSFRNDLDKVAFAVHASFLASGYVPCAVGPAAFSPTALSSTSTDEVGIDGWNEVEGEYAFLYSSPEKGGKKVLVKCMAMGDKLFVNALPDGAKEQVQTEIDAKEYVNEAGSSNYAEQYKTLDEFVKKLEKEVLSKLVVPKPSSSSSASPVSSGRDYRPRHDSPGPAAIYDGPAAIYDGPAGIYGPNGPAIDPTSGVVIPPVLPFGGSDAFPGPGAGMYPERGDFGGGSMVIGPNDPRWFGGVGGQPGFPGGLPNAPPGARFDPYGPPGVPGFEPNRFRRDMPRRGGGVHPDLEHFGGGSDFI